VLPAPHRLRRRRDFGVATRRGRRAGSATVVAHLATTRAVDPAAEAPHEPTDPPAPPRVGFVVSAAVGPAVVRNRVRRRLRHLAADQLRRLPDGSLLVLRARPAAAAASSAQLAADLRSVLDGLVSQPVTGTVGRPTDAPA
jgi:ribonuclease P protein component